MSNLAPDDARELVLARVAPLPAEPVAIADGLGRVLAQDVSSAEDVPGFDSSAMDGFAVRAGDTAGASEAHPVELALSGESRAGRPSVLELEAGQAIAISTGAVVPSGADAVVKVEDSRARDGAVAVLEEAAAGDNVRRAGEDIRSGQTVLARGKRLGPAELGVLASLGVAEVSCAKRPRVALFTTGDELVEPGQPLLPGQIRNSNAYSVSAQARRAGAVLERVEIVPDDRAATVELLGAGLAADVLVVSGGVSVGPHDHVKPAFAELGVEEVFWGLALRPGHPTWFGIKQTGARQGASSARCLVFGLPGNPVSAMVTFHLLARPALDALQGAVGSPRRTEAVMDEDYRKRPGRLHAVRCRLEARADGWHVRPTKEQGSHVLTSMLDAEALALIEMGRGDVKAGERVEIELLLE